MEAVIFEDTPLANYLEGEGRADAQADPNQPQYQDASEDSSSSFAPRGRPIVRPRFKHNLPPPLRLAIPQHNTVAAIHNACSKAVNSRLGRADNAKFLERFRYIIVASQLLDTHSHMGAAGHSKSRDLPVPFPSHPQIGAFTFAGILLTASVAFSLAWLIHWGRGGANSAAGKGRLTVCLIIVIMLAMVSYADMRRQWLQYLRQQTISEITEFVSKSHDFDSAASGALTLVQEVELVSRGYRLSTPLPPVSRLDDKSQTRRCARLRKRLRLCFADVLPRCIHACKTLTPFAEEMDLERYFDIYDINDDDVSEAMLSYSDTEFEDSESVRVLKILASRFHTMRKIFLCSLMALNADGGKPDFVRWSTAVDEIHGVCVVIGEAESRLRQILSEEETFPVPPTPKLPYSPGREKWRKQLRNLNSLSTGIRGLQAKLHVLRDESDKNLNETEDVSELGANLVIQFDSIGVDLKALMQEWEDGKAALASNIDRNSRRVSSMSGMLSPTISLGGLTAVEENGGTAVDALKALNGEPQNNRYSMDFSSSDVEEVFEAVALPPTRQRSTLTREDRIIKMKEDRTKRESLRTTLDSNTKMLRELQSVINMRPRAGLSKGRTSI